MQKKVLDDYVCSFEYRKNSVLKSFDDSLVDSSFNTRKAYNTDIWIFLRDKLFYFWDFRVRYNTVAQNLALVHTLDLVDQKISNGKMKEKEGQKILDEVLGRTKKLLSAPEKTKSLVKRKINSELLGKNFSCRYYDNGDRFTMRLRSPDNVEDVNGIVKIRQEDKIMMDFIFSNYGSNMDDGFWKDIFREDKIGEVLRHEEEGETGVSKNTLARRMISLRRFEGFLYRSERLRERIMIDMKIPSVKLKLQVCLDDNELNQLIKYSEKEYRYSKAREKLIASRNRAMIGVLAGTLIRGSALCNSRAEDLDFEKRELYVREKGRKELIVPLQGKTFDYLRDYVANYREDFIEEFVVGGGNGNNNFLFYTARGMQMNRRSLSRIINDYAKASGIKKNVNGKTCVGSHAIRRSCADSMSQKGARIEDIRDVLGHRSVLTTERYLRGLRNIVSSVRKTIDKYNGAVK